MKVFLAIWVIFWVGVSLYFWHLRNVELEKIRKQFRRAHIVFKEMREEEKRMGRNYSPLGPYPRRRE